jgi:hypothetical protein
MELPIIPSHNTPLMSLQQSKSNPESSSTETLLVNSLSLGAVAGAILADRYLLIADAPFSL